MPSATLFFPQDLFIELSKLATRGDLDVVIVESSGISEPLPVAETFTFRDARGTSLGDVARLDTLATVVDGASFLDELGALEALRDRGWEVSDEDDRTVAQLLCDQLEFANVIVINKTDLLDEESMGRVTSVLRRFNPSARITEAAWGRVDPGSLLGTGLFDMAQAAQHPAWLKEARVGEHTSETEEYGISSVTFRSRRPFDVRRFEVLTATWEEGGTLIKGVAEENSTEEEKKTDDAKRRDDANRPRVLRAKGLIWLATQQSHWQQGTASLAGRRFSLSYGVPWAATVAGAQDTSAAATALGEEPWGDRRTELVVIGQHLDRAAMIKALKACVVTDQEMDDYAGAFAKAKPLDVLAGAAASDSDGDLAARLRRFEIEVLVPKERPTQTLEAAPVSTEPVSAHATIAKYQGDGRFGIQRYLRYAHLFPELASGLVKEFALSTDAADAQTALLTDETDGEGLTATIARLEEGDVVELEWLQIRVERDTTVDEERFRMVEQCQKLQKINRTERKSLEREHPKPQIMIKKDRMGGGSCSLGEQGPQKEKKSSVAGKVKKKGKKRR